MDLSTCFTAASAAISLGRTLWKACRQHEAIRDDCSHIKTQLIIAADSIKTATRGLEKYTTTKPESQAVKDFVKLPELRTLGDAAYYLGKRAAVMKATFIEHEDKGLFQRIKRNVEWIVSQRAELTSILMAFHQLQGTLVLNIATLQLMLNLELPPSPLLEIQQALDFNTMALKETIKSEIYKLIQQNKYQHRQSQNTEFVNKLPEMTEDFVHLAESVVSQHSFSPTRSPASSSSGSQASRSSKASHRSTGESSLTSNLAGNAQKIPLKPTATEFDPLHWSHAATRGSTQGNGGFADDDEDKPPEENRQALDPGGPPGPESAQEQSISPEPPREASVIRISGDVLQALVMNKRVGAAERVTAVRTNRISESIMSATLAQRLGLTIVPDPRSIAVRGDWHGKTHRLVTGRTRAILYQYGNDRMPTSEGLEHEFWVCNDPGRELILGRSYTSQGFA